MSQIVGSTNEVLGQSALATFASSTSWYCGIAEVHSGATYRRRGTSFAGFKRGYAAVHEIRAATIEGARSRQCEQQFFCYLDQTEVLDRLACTGRLTDHAPEFSSSDGEFHRLQSI